MDSFKNLLPKLINSIVVLSVLIIVLIGFIIYDSVNQPKTVVVESKQLTVDNTQPTNQSVNKLADELLPPDISKIPKTKEGEMIRYGREL